MCLVDTHVHLRMHIIRYTQVYYTPILCVFYTNVYFEYKLLYYNIP